MAEARRQGVFGDMGNLHDGEDNTFNGMPLPSIAVRASRADGILREFDYLILVPIGRLSPRSLYRQLLRCVRWLW